MDRSGTTEVRFAHRRPGREKLQLQADRVLYQHGLGSGIDELLKAAGVSRGTLYNNYGSKAGLIEGYLERRHEATLAMIREASSRHEDPGAAIADFFDSLAQRSKEPGYRGCAFVLAAAELPVVGMKWATRHKRAIRDEFATLCDGFVDDPVVVAEQLLLVYDGSLVSSSLRGDDVDPFAHATQIAHLILSAHAI
jgi:AcrR family transcriptional regulator